MAVNVVAPNTRGLNIQPWLPGMPGFSARYTRNIAGGGYGTGYPRGFHPTKRFDDEGGGGGTTGQGTPPPQPGGLGGSTGYQSPYYQPLRRYGDLFLNPRKLFSRFYQGQDPNEQQIGDIAAAAKRLGGLPSSPRARGGAGYGYAGAPDQFKRLLLARAAGQ